MRTLEIEHAVETLHRHHPAVSLPRAHSLTLSLPPPSFHYTGRGQTRPNRKGPKPPDLQNEDLLPRLSKGPIQVLVLPPKTPQSQKGQRPSCQLQ